MAYPYSSPSESMSTIWTSGQYTPSNVVAYIRDDQSPINKNTMRNSVGYQISLIQNFFNSHYVGRSETPIDSGYYNNIYLKTQDGQSNWKISAVWDSILSKNTLYILPQTDDGDDNGGLILCGGGGTTTSRGGWIGIWGNEASGFFDAPGEVVINGSGYVALKTDNTVRLKAWPNGNILIGDAGDPDELLHVKGNIKSSNTIYSDSIYVSGDYSQFFSSTNQTYIKLENDALALRSSGDATIYSSGSLTFYSWDQMYFNTWHAHMNFNVYGDAYRFNVSCHGTDGYMSYTAPYVNLCSLQSNGYIDITAANRITLQACENLQFKTLPTTQPTGEYQVWCDVSDSNRLKCTTYS